MALAVGQTLAHYRIIAAVGAGGMGEVYRAHDSKLNREVAIKDSGYFHEFDVSADGQRFLLIRTEPESRPVRLDIILNWFDELRRKVG